MNQALQMPLFSRILSLHSNRNPLKDFHLGDTIFPLQSSTNIELQLLQITSLQINNALF